MNEEYKIKPDIATTSVYPVFARALMSEMHNNQLEMISRGLKNVKDDKTLVVVGPGAEVLPISEKKEWLVEALDGGNLMLMDYNDDICTNKIPAFLKCVGFDKEFSIENIVGNNDPREGNNRILVQARDIRDGYAVPDESISGIDMTIAVHHATQYEEDILDFFNEAYRALQPGGFIHIGEGNVDMKYNERKLHKIADDLIDYGAEGARIIDARYSSNKPMEIWKGNGNNVNVFITGKGMLGITKIDDAAGLADYLTGIGYKQMMIRKDANELIMPYIDHAMEEDFQGLIVPVRGYYKQVVDDCIPNLEPKYREAFMDAISKERSDAERGLVEFYSPPQMLIDNLKKADFKVDDVRYTTHGPFVNILAIKGSAR